MKPSDIFSVLDIAKTARENGLVFNPLFSGEAGLGKSQICQQWVKEQQKQNETFGFIDLRLAFFEGPDFVGLPKIVKDSHGKDRTDHIIPNFFPESGSGLLLFEEPNRANASVMNCMMQILTDRVVHHYKLPENWIIAGCVNPDNMGYDVNTMDSALADRFEIFDIEYDYNTFISFMESKNWSKTIVNFIKSGNWMYKTTEEIGDQGKYVSPRTWSKLNTAEQSGAASNTDIHFKIIQAILGKTVGRDYYSFVYEKRPVTVEDIIANKKDALSRLKEYSNPDNYQGGLVSVTVETFLKNYPSDTVNNDMLIDIAKILPSDQAVSLLQKALVQYNSQKGLIGNREAELTLKDLVGKDSALRDAIRSGLKSDDKK